MNGPVFVVVADPRFRAMLRQVVQPVPGSSNVTILLASSVEVEATETWRRCKQPGSPSFYVASLFHSLRATNETEAFRMRMRGGSPKPGTEALSGDDPRRVRPWARRTEPVNRPG